MRDKGWKLVAICEFGRYEYGDLSYTIGAWCLRKLEELAGTDVFDAATANFLEQYRGRPATLDDFCRAYAESCGEENKPAVGQFFQDWIYSSRGYERYI